MDLATALQEMTTISESKKQELLAKYNSGKLSETDKEELKEHLSMLVIHYKNLAEREQAFEKMLSKKV